jgi:hypothetical protein
LSVSRTGLPFSQLSATASISSSFSMASAIAFRMLERSVVEVSPHAWRAAWAASRASSMSSGVERATSQNALPVAGLGSALYSPATGGTQCPPM